MKKLSHRFEIPLMGLIMMPTMLLGLPAIMTYRSLTKGAPFLKPWLNAAGQTVPPALLMVAVVGSLAKLFVTKVLVEPKQI